MKKDGDDARNGTAAVSLWWCLQDAGLVLESQYISFMASHDHLVDTLPEAYLTLQVSYSSKIRQIISLPPSHSPPEMLHFLSHVRCSDQDLVIATLLSSTSFCVVRFLR